MGTEPEPSADQLIAALGLSPHPEGGYYRETLRLGAARGGRAELSLIYFLLRRGQVSRWHRIDAVETWHHYLGAPLLLRIAPREGPPEELRLGPSPVAGDLPRVVVRAGAWQSATPLGECSLVGCVSVPAFEFSGFELAAPDWNPGP